MSRVKNRRAEKDFDLIEKVREITDVDYHISDLFTYQLIEDLIFNYEKLQREYDEYIENEKNNDYCPEREVPEIHGKGISY